MIKNMDMDDNINNNNQVILKELKDLKKHNIIRNEIDVNCTKLSLPYSYNKIIIGNTIFNELTELEILELHKSNIIELEYDSLNNLRNLRVLLLGGNLFKTLPYCIFEKLRNLRALYLNDGKLTNLYNGIFNGLIQLECLDLSNNNLSSLHETTFNKLYKLKELNLSANKFELLPDNIFLNLTNLEKLDLNYNLYLKSLPYSIKYLKLKKYNCDNYLLKFPKSSVKKWHNKNKKLKF